jgi:hypothetical protein
LWELIERESFYDSTEAHLAWVIGDLVERSLASIACRLEFLFVSQSAILRLIDTICVLHRVSPVHIPELIQGEHSSRLSDTPIGKKYWATRILYLNNDTDDNKKREEDYESAK